MTQSKKENKINQNMCFAINEDQAKLILKIIRSKKSDSRPYPLLFFNLHYINKNCVEIDEFEALKQMGAKE